jgi:hypothetical protein
MTSRSRTTLAALFAAITMLFASAPASAQEERGGPTPPRLAFIDGDVSFWRPGAEDWVPAQVNTALAEGDQLYAAGSANVELQLGTRAFVRAGSDTQIGLENLDDDRMQFEVTGGHAAFDIARLPSGTQIEIDTPRAAFTIDRPGYYRVDVDDQRTAFVARRSGVARVTAENGEEIDVGSDQSLVLADDHPGFAVQQATAQDEWDRWNIERTSGYGPTPRSATYVPPDVAGVDDLDRYGDWQEEPRYGRVWRPREVAPDWSPYSAGRWVYDPYYEWTWVDDAPWGWAPYHYGRWVYTSGFWGWAPGPVVVHPVYAPALVAFFGAPGIGVSVSVGAPFVSWCPLGFGEPVIPWWGHYAGRPYWGGWGGPHIVNNVVINNTRFVNARNITHFQNFGVRNAVVGIDHDRFRRGGRPTRIDDRGGLQLVHGNVPVRPGPQSFVAREGRGRRPPEHMLHRPVVTTRQPRDPMQRLHARGAEVASPPTPRREARVVHPRGGGNRRVAESAQPATRPGAGMTPGAPNAPERRVEHDRGDRRFGAREREGGFGARDRARGFGGAPPPPRGQARLEHGVSEPVPPAAARRRERADERMAMPPGARRNRADERTAAPPTPRHERGARAEENALRRPDAPRAGLRQRERGDATPPPRGATARPSDERRVRRETPRNAPRGLERRQAEPPSRERMNTPRDAMPVPMPRGDRTRFERPRSSPPERSARRDPAPMRREAPRMERPPRPAPAPRAQRQGRPQGHPQHEGHRAE